jgi:hypothetical protein
LGVYERMPGIPEPIVIKGFHPKVGAWKGAEQWLNQFPAFANPLFCLSLRSQTPCI